MSTCSNCDLTIGDPITGYNCTCSSWDLRKTIAELKEELGQYEAANHIMKTVIELYLNRGEKL